MRQRTKYLVLAALIIGSIGGMASGAWANLGASMGGMGGAGGGIGGKYQNPENQIPPTGGATPSTLEEQDQFHQDFNNFFHAFSDYATHQVESANAGNGAAATNAGAIIQEHDIGLQHNITGVVQQNYTLLDGMLSLSRIETTQAADAQSAAIKSNQAEEKVFAAADDLANAMTMAILNHYSSKSKNEVIAELIEEGKSYGYVSPDFNVTASNTHHPFSFISKAYASTGQAPSNIFAMGADKGGAPVDCSGANSQYGVGNKEGDIPVAQDRCRANIYGAKLAYLSALPDEPDCGKSVASVNCDFEMVANRMATMVDKGEIMKNRIRKTIFNARAQGGGGQSDNSDHSPFFISKAYAAPTNSGGKVEQFVQQLGQAQQQSCQAHKQIHELEAPNECGSGVATALQNKYAHELAACCSGSFNAVKMYGTSYQEVTKGIFESGKIAALTWDEE